MSKYEAHFKNPGHAIHSYFLSFFTQFVYHLQELCCKTANFLIIFIQQQFYKSFFFKFRSELVWEMFTLCEMKEKRGQNSIVEKNKIEQNNSHKSNLWWMLEKAQNNNNKLFQELLQKCNKNERKEMIMMRFL